MTYLITIAVGIIGALIGAHLRNRAWTEHDGYVVYRGKRWIVIEAEKAELPTWKGASEL